MAIFFSYPGQSVIRELSVSMLRYITTITELNCACLAAPQAISNRMDFLAHFFYPHPSPQHPPRACFANNIENSDGAFDRTSILQRLAARDHRAFLATHLIKTLSRLSSEHDLSLLRCRGQGLELWLPNGPPFPSEALPPVV